MLVLRENLEILFCISLWFVLVLRENLEILFCVFLCFVLVLRENLEILFCVFGRLTWANSDLTRVSNSSPVRP